MKKLFVLLAVFSLLLTAFGCTAQEVPQEEPESAADAAEKTEEAEPAPDPAPESLPGLRVGYARAEIMPEDSVPLAGYGNTSLRMSQTALDTLYATCIAISDAEDNTVLLVTMDMIRASKLIVSSARKAISEETGIPVEHIMMAATHTHSAPDIDNTQEASILAYRDKVKDALMTVALEALADREAAEMYAGSVEATGLNFVRHYKMADGTYAGDSFGSFTDSAIVGHTTEADPTMHLVRFAREAGEDVVLCNWRAHPTKTGGLTKTNISADYISPLRTIVEKEMDCLFAFFQGASGNINASSRIAEEQPDSFYHGYGEDLARFAVEGLSENLRKVEADRILTAQTMLSAEVNHSTDGLFLQAREIQDLWWRTSDNRACAEAGAPYGIRSPYHAGAILSRMKMGKTKDLELNAIVIGDVAFVTAPNELFDTNSVYVEEHSPCGTTFTLTCCNESMGYIPSQLAYDYTCYESDTSWFVPGTGELIADAFVSMLNELHD